MYTLKLFRWSDEKNENLKKARNLSFEDILDCFENGNYFGRFENPSGNFVNQEVLLVKINGYPCIVPFVETENEIFLKTIIPDRRFKKFIEEDK